MKIAPSRWSWNRFKDLLNFYTLLGVIPSTLVILGLNLFVGPAKLAEIPEGYVPEHWEYHSVVSFIFVAWFVPDPHACLTAPFDTLHGKTCDQELSTGV